MLRRSRRGPLSGGGEANDMGNRRSKQEKQKKKERGGGGGTGEVK